MDVNIWGRSRKIPVETAGITRVSIEWCEWDAAASSAHISPFTHDNDDGGLCHSSACRSIPKRNTSPCYVSDGVTGTLNAKYTNLLKLFGCYSFCLWRAHQVLCIVGPICFCTVCTSGSAEKQRENVRSAGYFTNSNANNGFELFYNFNWTFILMRSNRKVESDWRWFPFLESQ